MKDGISLLILLITIVIIVILSSTIIVSFSSNNPINKAKELVFKSDIQAFENDLSIYGVSQSLNTVELFNLKNLQANDNSVTYNNEIVPNKTIKDIIPSLSKTDKYAGQLEIVDGELIYKGIDEKAQKWAQDMNVQTKDINAIDISAISETTDIVNVGTNIVCDIKLFSNVEIDNINLAGNIEILDKNNIAISPQPMFEIAMTNETNSDISKNVNLTINTSEMKAGKYKLKIKSGCISNVKGAKNEKDVITGNIFELSNVLRQNPQIIYTPITWTNSDVTLSVLYSLDKATREYSVDGVHWNTYRFPVTIANNTTIYARAIDEFGNQSGQSTLTVANIDKVLPIVNFTTNGGTSKQELSTTVTVTDNESGINESTLKYVWDTQNTLEPSEGWTSFVNKAQITKTGVEGTYYLWIKCLDNAGNIVMTKSEPFIIDTTSPTNPTMLVDNTQWTNTDVTLAITYSKDTKIKEYSRKSK